VNIGLKMLGESLRAQGAEVVDVDWKIPAGGDASLVAALTRLYGPCAERIEAANREVLDRLDQGAPVVVGVAPAHSVVPDMDERTVLHPGPPLPWEEFCDPLRRSVRAAVIAEGWAADPAEAEACISGGEVRLEPANWHAAAVPMATALGPTAPVWIVEHPQGGNRAFSSINQGSGKAAWFGVETPEAVDRLVWLREEAGPVLDAALRASGPVDVFRFAAQGLQMGDDLHMRVQAATNHLIRHLLPHLAGQDDARRVSVTRFLSANHLFFLNLAMAAAKAVADWAAVVSGSSIVVGMARNGTTFGIRLAGMPNRWFVAPAPAVGGALFHPGYGPDDGAPDIGDSAVLELVGLGGPAAAASPAVAAFLGRGIDQAIATTEEMATICAGESTRFQIPYLDFRGTPLGVDVRKVVERALTPRINTGILHARDGIGQIGAGIAEAPLDCFHAALLALNGAEE